MPTRYCEISGEKFEVNELEVGHLGAFDAPLPDICPAERQRQRTCYRNFRHLYRRPCSATGKMIVSMYAPEQPFPVLESGAWWADDWDPLSFGREYDPSRSFFEQYRELTALVPRFALAAVNSENCDYANLVTESKNCYLVFGCVRNEDCIYGHIVWDCVGCLDTLYAYRSQWCSHSVDIVDCYEVHFSAEATNCRESYFLYDCQNCQHCFGCFGLRNERHCFFNEQCSEAEYFKRLAQILPLDHERVDYCTGWLAQAARNEACHPVMQGMRNENVTGNHIYECRDLVDCFDMKRSESCAHCYTGWSIENSSDISFTGGGGARWSYNSLTMFNSERAFCSHFDQNCYDISYSEFCFGSHDLLGCNGLRQRAYCILNRQYSRSDYETLHARIVSDMKLRGDWGRFFPAEHSPFAYNESIAAEYQPLTKSEVTERGMRWRELPEVPEAAVAAGTHDAAALDDESVLKTVFRCAVSGRSFRIQRRELLFYRERNLPLPMLCPDERLSARMRQRAPREFFERICSGCGQPIRTAFPEAQFGNVRCDSCGIEPIRRTSNSQAR